MNRRCAVELLITLVIASVDGYIRNARIDFGLTAIRSHTAPHAMIPIDATNRRLTQV